MNKRRFYSKDFNKDDVKDFSKDDVIIDMNDIKGVFREFVMMKIDLDLENVVRKYMSNKLNKK
tara:strand:+ start:1292 stop:1480 length:189 start_codon:yes stop_codon:yes gene_type:complete